MMICECVEEMARWRRGRGGEEGYNINAQVVSGASKFHG
jgi:hypothetical protein